MKDDIWLQKSIQELKEKSKDLNFKTTITNKNVLDARILIESKSYSTEDFFVLLTSLNLLNAAIKMKEFKPILSYNSIKGNVSRVIHYLSSINLNKYQIEFYINPIENCAYVEIYDLQFSFHNIKINERIEQFIDSKRNNIKPWMEIRLQKIAGELFNLALEYKSKRNNS